MQKHERNIKLFKEIKKFYFPWLDVFSLKEVDYFIYNSNFYKFVYLNSLNLYNFQITLLSIKVDYDNYYNNINKYYLLLNFKNSFFFNKDIFLQYIWFNNFFKKIYVSRGGNYNFLKFNNKFFYIYKYLHKLAILKSNATFIFSIEKTKKYKKIVRSYFYMIRGEFFSKKFRIKYNLKKKKLKFFSSFSKKNILLKKKIQNKKFKIYLKKLYFKKLRKKNKFYIFLFIYRFIFKKFYKINLRIYRKYFRLNFLFWINLLKSIKKPFFNNKRFKKFFFLKKSKKKINFIWKIKDKIIYPGSFFLNKRNINNLNWKILLFYTLFFFKIKNKNLTIYENFWKFDYNKFKSKIFKYLPYYINYVNKLNLFYKDHFYNCIIKKTRSNLFVTVVNRLGDVIFSYSAGQVLLLKKKKKRKSSFALNFLIREVAGKLKFKNIFKFHKIFIHIKFRHYTKTIVNEFFRNNIKIKKIFYIYKRTHGLRPRLKKIRRI